MEIQNDKKLAGTKTEKNLETAFAGESGARNKYTFFASKAKKEGYPTIAKIFEESEESSVIKIMHFLAPETLGSILQVMSKEISKDEKAGAKINHLLESFRLSEEVKK